MIAIFYHYLRHARRAERGEITLWGAIGIAVLVIAYITFPGVFESFFDWVRSYFVDGLEEMKEDKKSQRGPDFDPDNNRPAKQGKQS
jgi:multisubunit Na+/H+ antiporter MnhB subunit